MRGVLAVIACASACSFQTLAPDGPLADGPRDGSGSDVGPSTIMLAASQFGHGANNHLAISLTIPPGNDRFLLVHVAVGSQSGDPSVPAISTVSFGSAPLAKLAMIVGTPSFPNLSRSELWELVAPPTGNANVSVMLTGNSKSLHVAALAFTGVDPATPVRSTAASTGNGASSSVFVASTPSDLVVAAVGQGSHIDAPDPSQPAIFIDNVSTSTTLDNTAASSASAQSASTTTMTWTFATSAEWQMLGAALAAARQ